MSKPMPTREQCRVGALDGLDRLILSYEQWLARCESLIERRTVEFLLEQARQMRTQTKNMRREEPREPARSTTG